MTGGVAGGNPAEPAPPRQVVIGLDAGTTSVKAVAFGLEPGRPWRRVASHDVPPMPAAPDHQVQDPHAVVAASRRALADCVAYAGDAEVVAVSVTAAMHGLAALDGDRRPLTPLVTWADNRAAEVTRALHASGRAGELQARTGVPVHPMAPLAKLVWFARHDPATWRAARWWVGLKDLLLLWLTGSLVTELSSASATGLLDVATRAWSPLALDVCGVDAERLPPIESTTATLPLAADVADDVGLPAGTPVVTGAGDGPAGNVGTRALDPGVVGLSLGTSGAARIAVDSPRPDPTGRLFCYAITEETWVLGGAVSNGGDIVRWAGRALAPDVRESVGSQGPNGPRAAVDELAATAPPGCDGLVMLPYLLPGRAPLWDPELPGAYLGLRGRHTRAHMIRAAFEGVALQLRLVVDQIDAVEPVAEVHATGGALRARLWREVLAAMVGRPLLVTDEADGTALGAAALGVVALGLAPTPSAAADLLAGGREPTPPVAVDPAVVAVYDRLRASVPELVRGLGQIAGLIGDPTAARIPEPPAPPGRRRPGGRGDR